ncbi:MAG: hypothetical protein KF788_08800 [Piscinibacter sp.]|nr:hypothetical protein [Piscinibacter sp.]
MMLRTAIAGLLLAAAGAAVAQGEEQCLPDAAGGSMVASRAFVTFSAEGACVRWLCYLDTFSPQHPAGIQVNMFCGTLAELPKVGGRLQTIMKASDPLAMLRSAGKRFPIVPLSSDPVLARLAAEAASAARP